jgi:hypothetical protein
MHVSRIPEFGPPGLLTPLSLDLLAEHGMEPKDFTPLAFNRRQQHRDRPDNRA